MKNCFILCFILLSVTMIGCTPKASDPITTEPDMAIQAPIKIVSPPQKETVTPQTRTTVTIGSQQFDVEVVDTPAERQRGLMWRESLPPEQGMLFVFEREGFYPFWMKNTLIPLDVIWIAESGEIIDIHTLFPCPPETLSCPSTAPAGMARYVLEVNAGEFNGKVGDMVKIEGL